MFLHDSHAYTATNNLKAHLRGNYAHDLSLVPPNRSGALSITTLMTAISWYGNLPDAGPIAISSSSDDDNDNNDDDDDDEDNDKNDKMKSRRTKSRKNADE
ncbi:hypothetical protein Plec18167_001617 [Paecilomyces lecythidis]|uniref:Uncharacterized protein n=1 Tax=Paecilomyces lecythidis TaxID=3004212 RepID=A0ABR3YAE7_9EURO